MWYTVLVTLILDIGGLLLIYVLLRDRVRRAASSDAHIAEIRDEVSRLLVELNRTTDRNIALIEDRIASLNELLSSADKKIGLLRRESEKHDVGTQIYSRLAEGRSRVTGVQAPTAAGMPPVVAARMPQSRRETIEGEGGMPPGVAAGVAAGGGAPPLSVELSERAEHRMGRGAGMPPPRQEREGMPPGVAAGMPPGVAAGMPPPRQEREAAPDLHQRVMMLHNAGFASSLIASRVGAPLGEVELIISLQQRKGRV